MRVANVCSQHDKADASLLVIHLQTNAEDAGRPALVWISDSHLLGSDNLAFICSDVFCFNQK